MGFFLNKSGFHGISGLVNKYKSYGLEFEMKKSEYQSDQFVKALKEHVNEEKNIDLVVLSMGLEVGKTEANKYKSLAQSMISNEMNLPVLFF